MSTITPIEDALDDLRITGTVLLHESYAPPWAIDVPPEPQLHTMLGLRRGSRVLPFHLVRRNGFSVRMGTHPVLAVNRPEVLICPGGAAHRMYAGSNARAVAFEAILAGQGPAPADPGDGTATELVCGVMIVRATPLNPLLGALPPMLTVSTGAPQGAVLSGVADLLVAELERGSRGGFTASRLLEVFCAEAIRAFRPSPEMAGVGWFRGLADPKVSAAIRALHAHPAAGWTVASLAAEAALSPSRFAARFKGTTGETVMNYVGRWRANVACRLLVDTELSLAEIAGRTGYDSLPAFSRSFRALVGMPPGRWRSSAR